MSHADPHFMPLNMAVLTVSDTRSQEDDTSGQYLAEAIHEAGHQLHDRKLCTDNLYDIRWILSTWIADPQISVILTTGGTGFYPRDITPEAAMVLFDKTIDGFGELFRAVSLTDIGMATIQSRAIAGIANRTGIFCLPGSTNACKTAWQHILQAQLDSRTKPCNFVTHVKPLL